MVLPRDVADITLEWSLLEPRVSSVHDGFFMVYCTHEGVRHR